MAVIIKTSSSSTTTLANFDYLYLGPGINVVTSSSYGVVNGSSALGSTGTVVNYGSIGAALSGLNWTAANGEIVNDGRIFGLAESGIAMATSGLMTISNSGVITGHTWGIDANGSSGELRLTNTGRIEAYTNDILYDGNLAEIRIDNTGEMFGRRGIELGGTTSNYLVNTGTISAQYLGAIEGAVGAMTVINYGFISGQTSSVLGSGNADRIVNYGQLIGYINASSGDDTVTNSGDILGDVRLSVGYDILNNIGVIDGNVEMSDDDDIYNGFGGRVTGTIDGGEGVDIFKIDDPSAVVIGGLDFDTVYARSDFTSGGGVEKIVLQGTGNFTAIGDDEANEMVGNAGDNLMQGGIGNDTLKGGLGNDNLSGDDGDDLLYGQDGNDVLLGGAGVDFLVGQEGDDVVDGGADTDILQAGLGNDILIGGNGSDTMNGGGGADVFVYTNSSESGTGGTSDRIASFLAGVDLIDLSAINDQAFVFRGTQNFSANGDMEVRVLVNGVGHSVVYLDDNGDGVADARIYVWYTDNLTADDFIL